MKRPVIRSVADALRHGTSRPFGALNVRQPGWRRSIEDQAAHEAGRLPFIGHLWLAKVDLRGGVEDLGLVSCRVVTNAGVNFLTDAMQGLVEPEAMRFHGVGTSTVAEAVTQTALISELTTQYGSANTRPTGTLGEKAGSSNVFESSATITVSAPVALTEHGIFSQAAVGGGVLLDRSMFSTINLGTGESLQATYQLTLPSGN